MVVSYNESEKKHKRKITDWLEEEKDDHYDTE